MSTELNELEKTSLLKSVKETSLSLSWSKDGQIFVIYDSLESNLCRFAKAIEMGVQYVDLYFIRDED